MTEIDEGSVRAEVHAWLEANWNPDYGLVEWRKKLAECGWGVPHWPSRWYGRDLPVGLVPAVEEEFKRVGAIGVAKAVVAGRRPRCRCAGATALVGEGGDLAETVLFVPVL